MELLTRVVHKMSDASHDIHKPNPFERPPSKINSKESSEEGDDHLQCVGRSAECVASAQVSRSHII